MTAFYWTDSKQLAAIDAAEKQASPWMWAATKAELNSKNPLDFEAVYLKAGIMELEQEFARIMRENSPRCLC